ncbi:hypothetical protein CBR_g22434 [Chara braunii]|uniref:Uncharacterized protein n=1 Tax=Chara braunii TaxID=69332 RepID=A0A388JV08_CHABU|nr:hypothetical protein CBR_g22434 [Chara braunii]|eukprot:GBG61636.1 hypothetical protein CBR_g22434 [Chara braunii]
MASARTSNNSAARFGNEEEESQQQKSVSTSSRLSRLGRSQQMSAIGAMQGSRGSIFIPSVTDLSGIQPPRPLADQSSSASTSNPSSSQTQGESAMAAAAAGQLSSSPTSQPSASSTSSDRSPCPPPPPPDEAHNVLASIPPEDLHEDSEVSASSASGPETTPQDAGSPTEPASPVSGIQAPGPGTSIIKAAPLRIRGSSESSDLLRSALAVGSPVTGSGGTTGQEVARWSHKRTPSFSAGTPASNHHSRSLGGGDGGPAHTSDDDTKKLKLLMEHGDEPPPPLQVAMAGRGSNTISGDSERKMRSSMGKKSAIPLAPELDGDQDRGRAAAGESPSRSRSRSTRRRIRSRKSMLGFSGSVLGSGAAATRRMMGGGGGRLNSAASVSMPIPRFAFGMDSRETSSVVPVENNAIAYVCGSFVTIANLSTFDMRFLHSVSDSRVKVLRASMSRRLLVLVEQSVHDETWFVVTYTWQHHHTSLWKAHRTLALSKEGRRVKDVVDVCVPKDEASVVIVFVNEDGSWGLVSWRLTGARLSSPFTWGDGNQREDPSVQMLSASPWEATRLAANGRKNIRFFSISGDPISVNQSVVSTGLKQDSSFTRHAWLMAELVAVATDKGEVLLYEDEVFLGTLTLPEPLAIERIVTLRQGFFVVDVVGMFTVFELTAAGENRVQKRGGESSSASKPVSSSSAGAGGPTFGGGLMGAPYAIKKTFKPTADRIMCVSLFFPGTRVVCGLESANIGVLELEGEEEGVFELLRSGFHTGPVLGLDSCVQKRGFVSFGADHSIRLWNYESKKCTLRKTFHEACFSVSLHPSGFYLVAGMVDKVRLFYVLGDDLRCIREIFIPASKLVSFSKGGQLFAVCKQNLISVFQTYNTLSTAAGILRGHTSNIKGIHWGPSDATLVSCGQDGAVYVWDVYSYSRDRDVDHVKKMSSYSCITYNKTATVIVVAGLELPSKICKIKAIVKGAVEHETLVLDCTVTCMALGFDDKVLFAGTSTGAIRAYEWFGDKVPKMDESQSEDNSLPFAEVRLHASAVTQIRLIAVHTDNTGSLLVSVGEDGVVFICGFPAFDAASQSRPSAEPIGSDMTEGSRSLVDRTELPPEAFLLLNSDYRELVDTVHDLQAQIENMQIQHDFEFRRSENGWQEMLRRMKDDVVKVQREARDDQEKMKTEMKGITDKYEKKMATMDQVFKKQMSEAERMIADAVSREEEQRSQAAKRMKEKKLRNQAELEQAKDEHEAEVQALMSVYSAQIEQLHKETVSLTEKIRLMERYSQEMIDQQEKDQETQLDLMDQNARRAIAFATGLNEDLKVRFALVDKGRQEALQREEQAHGERQEMEDLAKKALEQRDLLTSRIVQYEDVLTHFESTIKKKDKALQRLRSSTEELEVQKYVLNENLRMMREKEAPQQEKIHRLALEAEDTQLLMRKYLSTVSSLKQANKENLDRVKSARDELQAANDVAAKRKGVMDQLCRQLSIALSTEDEREKWKKLQKMYADYCLGHPKLDSSSDIKDALEEVKRQRMYIQNKLQANTEMKLAFKKMDDVRWDKALADNVFLLMENRQLRREIKQLTFQLYAMDSSKLSAKQRREMASSRISFADDHLSALRPANLKRKSMADVQEDEEEDSKGGRDRSGSREDAPSDASSKESDVQDTSSSIPTPSGMKPKVGPGAKSGRLSQLVTQLAQELKPSEMLEKFQIPIRRRTRVSTEGSRLKATSLPAAAAEAEAGAETEADGSNMDPRREDKSDDKGRRTKGQTTHAGSPRQRAVYFGRFGQADEEHRDGAMLRRSEKAHGRQKEKHGGGEKQDSKVFRKVQHLTTIVRELKREISSRDEQLKWFSHKGMELSPKMNAKLKKMFVNWGIIKTIAGQGHETYGSSRRESVFRTGRSQSVYRGFGSLSGSGLVFEGDLGLKAVTSEPDVNPAGAALVKRGSIENTAGVGGERVSMTSYASPVARMKHRSVKDVFAQELQQTDNFKGSSRSTSKIIATLTRSSSGRRLVTGSISAKLKSGGVKDLQQTMDTLTAAGQRPSPSSRSEQTAYYDAPAKGTITNALETEGPISRASRWFSSHGGQATPKQQHDTEPQTAARGKLSSGAAPFTERGTQSTASPPRSKTVSQLGRPASARDDQLSKEASESPLRRAQPAGLANHRPHTASGKLP